MTTKQIINAVDCGDGLEGYRHDTVSKKIMARKCRAAAQAVQWWGGGHRIGDVSPRRVGQFGGHGLAINLHIPRGRVRQWCPRIEAYIRLLGRIG